MENRNEEYSCVQKCFTPNHCVFTCFYGEIFLVRKWQRWNPGCPKNKCIQFVCSVFLFQFDMNRALVFGNPLTSTHLPLLRRYPTSPSSSWGFSLPSGLNRPDEEAWREHGGGGGGRYPNREQQHVLLIKFCGNKCWPARSGGHIHLLLQSRKSQPDREHERERECASHVNSDFAYIAWYLKSQLCLKGIYNLYNICHLLSLEPAIR